MLKVYLWHQAAVRTRARRRPPYLRKQTIDGCTKREAFCITIPQEADLQIGCAASLVLAQGGHSGVNKTDDLSTIIR